MVLIWFCRASACLHAHTSIYQDEVKTGSYGIVCYGQCRHKVYSSGSDSPIACEKACSNYQIVNVKNDILTLISKQLTGN